MPLENGMTNFAEVSDSLAKPKNNRISNNLSTDHAILALVCRSIYYFTIPMFPDARVCLSTTDLQPYNDLVTSRSI